jgi:hypothetical protein
LQNVYLYNLFPFPLIKFKFLNHNKYVFREVNKTVKKPASWECEVNTSFPNILDDDPIVSKEIRNELIRDIESEVKSLFLSLNAPHNIKINEIWYSIYHDSQGQEAHWHMPVFGSKNTFVASWSGIYYNKNASPTVFCRKDDNLKFYDATPYINSQLEPFFRDSFAPDVEDGDIVIFPPYLFHKVQTDDSFKNKMRMTFAFNFSDT